MKSINELRAFLVDNGLVGKDDIVGCSEEEIDAVEKMLGLSFPGRYKDFLKVFGKGAGPGFLPDVNFQLDDLITNREKFRRWLPNVYSPHLLPIFCRYGETFGLIDLETGEDPQLKIVSCDDDEIIQYEEIADFFYAVAEENLAMSGRKSR